MSRRRTKGCLPVLLLMLAVGAFGRGRQTAREDPPTGSSPPIAEVPAQQPETQKPVRIPPAPERSSSARPGIKLAVKVVGVHDGDTITGLDDTKTQHKIRLDAIDAPELGQPFGQASKRALSEMVFGRDVTVIRKTTDRYGRTVGHVLIDGRDVNLAMLEAGMAWHYKEYDRNKRLAEAEISARDAKIGLWRDGGAVPPWDWRAAERARRKVAPP